MLPKTRHYAALGRFIVECSLMEMCLNLLLRRVIGIDERLTRIIVGGTGDVRVADLIRLTKQVSAMKATDDEVSELQNRLLDWATYVNDLRSVVAHKPFWREKGDVMVFHNTHHAKTEERKWKYRCSVKQLNNLSKLMDNMNIVFFILPKPHMFKGGAPAIALLPDQPLSAALLQKLALPDRPADTRQTNAK